MLPLIGIGAALSVAGIGAKIFGGLSSSKDQKKAQEAYIRAQQEQERVRKEAMQFDADRQRRKAIREAIIGRSLALSNATNRGAGSSQGSSVPGAFGQVMGQAGFTITGVNAHEGFGIKMFDLNQQALAAKMAFEKAKAEGAMWNTIGSGLSSLGGALMGNATSIGGMFGGGGGGSGGFNLGFADPNGGSGIIGVGPYG